MTSFEFLTTSLVIVYFSKRILSPNSEFMKFMKMKDDSDPSGESRSNLRVLIDHKTGREYLAVGTMFGLTSITPRLPAERDTLVFPTIPKVYSYNKTDNPL